MKSRTRWSELSMHHITLEQAVGYFQVFNKTSGKSAHTVHWYDQRLALFLRWLEEQGIEPTLGALSVQNVRSYTLYLQAKQTRHDNNPLIPHKEGPLSTSYINGCIRPLRAFSTWLHEEDYLDENVLTSVRPPKVRKQLVSILSDDEVAALLAVPDQDDPFGARNFAMLWLMLDGGFRAQEVCGLTLDHSRLEDGFVKVLGKGDKERIVPIGAGAQGAALRWRDHFRPAFAQAPSGRLFLNANGHPLTVNALECVVRKIGTKSGVPRVYCHLLRHTFATNYLARGVGDPFRLQQILGHTSLEMVRHYVAFADVQQSLLESRTSVMDMLSLERERLGSRRRRQPRRTVAKRHVSRRASLISFPGPAGGRAAVNRT